MSLNKWRRKKPQLIKVNVNKLGFGEKSKQTCFKCKSIQG